jgi:hypothetical protein
MNREEREALTERATQRIVACLQQTTNTEQMIGSILTGYGIAMFAAGGRNIEEWIGRILASLPIPIFITRTLPEGSGEHEPVVAYHRKTQDLEGDGVTFAYCLEQALTYVMNQQEQQP